MITLSCIGEAIAYDQFISFMRESHTPFEHIVLENAESINKNVLPEVSSAHATYLGKGLHVTFFDIGEII